MPALNIILEGDNLENTLESGLHGTDAAAVARRKEALKIEEIFARFHRLKETPPEETHG